MIIVEMWLRQFVFFNTSLLQTITWPHARNGRCLLSLEFQEPSSPIRGGFTTPTGYDSRITHQLMSF